MTIVLELPILGVTVSNLPDPVTADVQYDLLCQVTGAQPPPRVTWRLGEQVLQAGEAPRLTHDSNLTTSEMAFTPKIRDQGKVFQSRNLVLKIICICSVTRKIYDLVSFKDYARLNASKKALTHS